MVLWKLSGRINKMKIVLQRVTNASVKVDSEIVGNIDKGFMLLVGITHEDKVESCKWLADKISGLRVFEDENGKMNLSLADVRGEVLSISQFTLYGDTKKGRRPSFDAAAKPDFANELYEKFNEYLRATGLNVETGLFGADMKVELLNDGPVTLILEHNG